MVYNSKKYLIKMPTDPESNTGEVQVHPSSPAAVVASAIHDDKKHLLLAASGMPVSGVLSYYDCFENSQFKKK